MMDKRSLMQKIYELGFAMDDMALYLDTHPKDKRALNYIMNFTNNIVWFGKNIMITVHRLQIKQ